MKYLNPVFFLVSILIFASCVEKPSLVDSGTYKAIIHTVNPDKAEIFVETVGEQLLELHFTKSTLLTKEGTVVPFIELAEGQKIEAVVELAGDRLELIAVKITKQ